MTLSGLIGFPGFLVGETIPAVATNTTTATAIAEQLATVIKALTPTSRPDRKFHRSRAPGPKSASDLRLFTLETSPESADLGVLDPAERRVAEGLILRVIYPVLPGLYKHAATQTDDGAIEAVILDDAAQLRDACFSSENYLSGQLACYPSVEPIERGDDFWTLSITLAVEFYKSQSIF